ncbi:toll-like receptor 3 [Mytilus galloprovincialis]|uniref:Toll-like receptor 3 n=1 Tax=Mytilus galloprovincialis TaxID=29158 RepID=A0A8B6BVA7_MYTGA|nr:toll-like receptor 3 [Mytilus galloprovincialis]
MCKVYSFKGYVTCDCSSLGLEKVPSNCPSNTSYINLSDNSLTELKPCAFCQSPDVKKLNLDNCPIFRITNTSFAQLDSLRVLLFRHNSLVSFKSNVFECLSNLRVLKISHELLASYPVEFWSDLSNISHLYTYDGPKDERFGKFLSAMKSLIYYNHGIGGCELQKIHNNTFESLGNTSLKALELVCYARYVELNAFEPVKYLSNLSLANQLYMKMSNVFPALHVFKDKSMDTLDLSQTFRYFGEFVFTANVSSFIGDICVKSLSMRGNNLIRIEGAAIANVKNKSCLQEIDLSLNRFNFNSVYSLLYTMTFVNLKRAYLAYANLCSPFQILVRKYKYQNITIPLPPSIEFINASNIKMLDVRTPQIVQFLHTEHLEVIDLADTTFDDCNFTIYGLNHLKVLNMSGQNCSILNYELLGSCSRLEILVMKHSKLGLGLESDTRGTFMYSLRSLKYLDLSGNDMYKPFIPQMFVHQSTTLTSLLLNDNSFKNIPVSMNMLRKLRTLSLKNNKINWLSQYETDLLEKLSIRILPHNFKLALKGNPIVCNCESLNFIQWIYTTKVNVDLKGNYSCLYTDGSFQTTFEIFENMNQLRTQCVSKVWLVLSVTLSTVLIFTFIISSLLYKYRISLQYCCLIGRGLYRHYRKINDNKDEYIYDAFVAHSQEDYIWVYGPFRTFLETEKNFKLALHDRDFVPGTFIADNIIDTIKVSRKIVFVVSRSFLDSEWCQYELDMARMHMFQQNREMLIIILLEDIPNGKLPSRLKQIWEKITCLETDEKTRNDQVPNGDNIFWKRLHLAIKP